jgi:hypothetical protein
MSGRTSYVYGALLQDNAGPVSTNSRIRILGSSIAFLLVLMAGTLWLDKDTELDTLQLWVPEDGPKRSEFLQDTKESYPPEVAADMNVSTPNFRSSALKSILNLILTLLALFLFHMTDAVFCGPLRQLLRARVWRLDKSLRDSVVHVFLRPLFHGCTN